MNDEQFQSAAGEPGNKAAGQNGGTTALRIFDQANGMNDFPVLKAFQEYIEAEQARAQTDAGAFDFLHRASRRGRRDIRRDHGGGHQP